MGTGGWNAGVKGREAGEERAEGGFPSWQEPGEIEKTFCNYFVIFCNRGGTKGRNHYGKGREAGVKGTGNGRFKPPCPSPSLLWSGCCFFFHCVFFQYLFQVKVVVGIL